MTRVTAIRKRIAIVVAVVMVGIGGWQTGSAAYIHAKAVVAQLLLEQAWQLTLAGRQAVKPWPWADTWPVARLEVPRLHESSIVLAGSGGDSLAFGPGHIGHTAQPGKPGISIISAHRDTHFEFLQYIRKDDKIVLTTAVGTRYVYRVKGMLVVDAYRFRFERDFPGRRLLLTTCYPFNAITTGGSRRYVVVADMEEGKMI